MAVFQLSCTRILLVNRSINVSEDSVPRLVWELCRCLTTMSYTTLSIHCLRVLEARYRTRLT